MFIYCKPEESEKLHRELLAIEKEIVDGLEIPYRVIDIASGDLGGPAYRKYDLEAFMVMRGEGKNRVITVKSLPPAIAPTIKRAGLILNIAKKTAAATLFTLSMVRPWF